MRQYPRKPRYLGRISATVSQLESEPVIEDAGKVIELIVEAGYDAYVEANYDKAPQRLDDIEQLGVFARQYETLETFLAELALLTNVEANRIAPRKMTNSAFNDSPSQGVGVQGGVRGDAVRQHVPQQSSLDSLDGKEEERRLFYVAITRAQDELYLYPMIRTVAGGGGDDMIQQPSLSQRTSRRSRRRMELRDFDRTDRIRFEPILNPSGNFKSEPPTGRLTRRR